MFDVQSFLEFATQLGRLWAPRVIAALLVLSVGWILAGWVKSASRRAIARSPVDDMLIPFLSGLIHVLVVMIVVVSAMSALGISTTSFVAVLGAAGLAIALAFQGTISHFAAGIMLLTFRPFSVDDVVEVGGIVGSVKEVGIFSCVLHTGDNVQVRVPNSQIFGTTIKNFSANENRRIDLLIGVSYGDDLGVAVRTCMDTVSVDPRVLADPAPVVAVHELGESSVNLVVRPWVRKEDYWKARWDLTRAVKENLESAGCSIPFPQRDVHLFEQKA